MLIINPKIREV